MKEDIIANLSDNLIMLSKKLNAQERKREYKIKQIKNI